MSIVSLLVVILQTALVSAVIVKTKQGVIEGYTVGDVNVFLGVPFAQPPVDQLRWKAPVPAAQWSGVLETTQIPPACPQEVKSGFNLTFQNEDCLYLNVYAPIAPPPPSGYPVMAWFYGGGFVNGAGAQYNGVSFVETSNIILVTVSRIALLLCFFGPHFS
jgi:para-nitrobenzyl esterase